MTKEPNPETCARGNHPIGRTRYVGWDDRGPICEDCWMADPNVIRSLGSETD